MLRPASLLCSLVLLALTTGCEEAPFPTDDELTAIRSLHSLPEKPPRDATNRFAENAVAASLGDALFHDPSLSACGTVSCQSCHGNEGRTVPEAFATGCNGVKTGRNPPSVVNTAYDTFFMWDGRADRLWSQAILPLTSPGEMGGTPSLLRERLDAGYAGHYQEVFGKDAAQTPDDELLANFGKAIAAYEWTLRRRSSQWDLDVQRFIKAVEDGVEEQDPLYVGLKTFVRKGQCAVCHKGPLLTDGRFHNIGVEDASPGARGAADALPQTFDWTFNAAGPYSDERSGPDSNRLQNFRTDLAANPHTYLGGYRTPSLRNVTTTGPFMHTGKLNTLAEVVEFYDLGGDPEGTFQGVKTDTIKKLELTDEEKAALVALLESMTGNP